MLEGRCVLPSGRPSTPGRAPLARGLECAGIATFAVLWSWLVLELAPRAARAPWQTGLAVVLAYLAADLVGGLVHWAVDTWGSPDVPIVGPAMIGPFREHHLDPLALTRHDFVETNGNSALITWPLLALALWLVRGRDGAGSYLIATFLTALACWVLLTNQFHKWAHVASPPRVVALLQRLRLILPPAHHARHHSERVESHYCITIGLMNELLARSGLLQVLELWIARWTGAVPWRGHQMTTDSTTPGSPIRRPHEQHILWKA
jgi:plasmanylethanolamine desaturase